MTFDTAIVQWLHDASLRTPLLAFSGRLIADYGVYVLPLALLIIWFAGHRQSTQPRREAIIVGCIAAAVAIGVGLVLERVLARPRPFVELGFVPLIPHAADSSFPSDHTLFSVALVSPLAWSLRPGGLLLLIWALLIGGARVVAGLHYPSDILGSVVLALVLDAVVLAVTRRVMPRLM